jgi:DNA-binding MarR family transcriptional regulator
MAGKNKSSGFTNSSVADAEPFGPPLIGALLRVPWEAVQEHMLGRLHDGGFADFDASYLTVFRYPSPEGERPSELAARRRVSKQALNHLLGQLEQRGYLKRDADPEDGRYKRIRLTPRGTKAVIVIREAVAEMEDSWAQQLGSKRFNQLRTLLQELNQPTSVPRRRPVRAGESPNA